MAEYDVHGASVSIYWQNLCQVEHVSLRKLFISVMDKLSQFIYSDHGDNIWSTKVNGECHLISHHMLTKCLRIYME